MASYLRKAQVTIRARGSNKCPNHSGKEVIFVCEDCGELICSKCVSSTHRKHAVDDISEIIPRLKVTIQDFVNEAEKMFIPKLNGELKNVGDKISTNKTHFKDVIFQITKQNENLKLELDIITSNLIALCREVENGNDNLLKRHRTELQTTIEELNVRLLEMKETLESGTNTQVYDISREIPIDVTIPAVPPVQNLAFHPTSYLIVQLEQLVQTTGDSQTQVISFAVSDQQRAYVPGENQNEDYKSRQEQMSEKRDCNSKKSSNSNVETFIEFQMFTHGKGIHSMCATANNQVWVKSGNRNLDMLNATGKTQKEMKMDVDITDFCVSPSTGDLWFCSYSSINVRKVIRDKSTVMFYTNTEPLSICISADGNTLVGMVRQIVKYSQHGHILCKSTQEKQIPVVRCPDRISCCPVTGNIVVMDRDSKNFGGDDKEHVSILNENLQLLCRYYGRDTESFCPWDACYSDTGDIYIANNKSIQRISGSGEFIKIVYTHSDKLARYVCEQSNGDIWIGFGYVLKSKEIIILQKQ